MMNEPQPKGRTATVHATDTSATGISGIARQKADKAAGSDAKIETEPTASSSTASTTRSPKNGKGATREGERKPHRGQIAASGAGGGTAGTGQASRSPKRTSANRHDWNEIRTRYIIGNESLREIAEKVPCGKTTIMARSRKEGWPTLREEYRRDLDAKTVQKAAAEAATERARIARIAVGGMGAISLKWKAILQKMEKTPPEEWGKDPEIAKLSPADYEKLAKTYLLLTGEATERHELKQEQLAPETSEAIWRIIAEERKREERKESDEL